MTTNPSDDDNQPRAERAYLRVLGAIRDGTLKPGARLREVELAEMLGISRTPVREAIRQLESAGLLIHLPRQGAVVRELSHREVIELYEMRAVLEGAAARFAARHASDVEIAELEELNAQMLAAAADPGAIVWANQTFHDVMYRAANNRFTIAALEAMSNAMALLGGTALIGPGRAQSAFDEHVAIVQAIANRDGDAAEEAARAHIRSALKLRMEMMRADLRPRGAGA